MKLIATNKTEQSQALLDPWSAVHAAAGLAFGLMRVSLLPATSAAIAYEVVEQIAQRSKPVQTFFAASGPEVPENAVVDVLVFMAGWWLGKKWNDTEPVTPVEELRPASTSSKSSGVVAGHNRFQKLL